jgi:choline-sulfatase
LRAFEVGCYGNPVISTPNIDRLAKEGVRFELAVSNYPVCMPARSVLLSGQYNRRCTGGVSNIAYPSQAGDFYMPQYPSLGRPHLKDPTLAEVLGKQGYYNAAIGKWHIHSWPHELGFNEFVIPRVNHCHSGQSYTENGGPEFVPAEYSVDFEASRVEAFLQGRKENRQPFFLFYNISPPHCPLADAPEEYLTMYDPNDIPLRLNVNLKMPLPQQDYWFKVYRWDFRYYHLHLPYTETLPEGYTLRHLLAGYYGLTTWADQAVGRMLAALDRTGLAENTLIIFCADHGDNLGSLGLVQKGGPNEEATRIPLIVRWPAGLGKQPKVFRQQVASLVDLAPTIIELCGGDVPGHIHGRSLAALLRGKREVLDEDYAFIETSGGIAIRTPTHVYASPWKSEKGILDEQPRYFYNLTRDPYQFHNLAEGEQESEVAQMLDILLREWHKETPGWMMKSEAEEYVQDLPTPGNIQRLG